MPLRTEHVEPYKQIEHYQCDNGYIVWRLGTGGNYEILHLRSNQPRKGTGRHLLQTMLKRVIQCPPRTSVFGFTWVANEEAQAFYKAMGFKLTKVKGLYTDGAAIFFSANYLELWERHCGTINPGQ